MEALANCAVTCSIVVRISAEVTKPRDDRPFDGIFTIAMELTAMGSPAWENGRYALYCLGVFLWLMTSRILAQVNWKHT